MLRIGISLSLIATVVLLSPTAVLAQQGASSLSEWLQLGHWLLDARYRLEQVDQDGFDEDALASTLRLRGGFETARWNGFSALIEAEFVGPLGGEKYNSTTNNRTTYPVVADPETSEINQALFYYKRGQNHLVVGRQKLPIDQQRFLGSVDFRQNQQTYDALMYMNRSIQGWTLAYGYMDGVRRFLSSDNPVGDIDMDAHILNVEYVSPNENRLTLYAQFLDMETPAVTAGSHRNLGFRYQGAAGTESLKWLYHVEYADQSSYANGVDIIDADYWRIEIGPRFANQWVLRFGIEQLSGNGTYGFQTPFATGHSFNGRADIFAGRTPGSGLRDQHAKLEAPLMGARVILAYHQFESDAGSIDYGDELDIIVSYRFRERFELAFEYADYEAQNFAGDKRNVSISLHYEM